MANKFNTRNLIPDFFRTLQAQRETIAFIRAHRLWEGFWKYGWVSRFILVAGLVVSFKFSGIIQDWWSSAEMDDPFTITQSMGMLFENVATEGYNFLFLGSFKYILLIFMEILIFHFARRTLEIKSGIKQEATLKEFVEAEIRMIKVAFMCWGMEMVGTIMIQVVLGIFGIDWLEMPAVFVLQCYFIGFIVLDNYNEIFKINIKDSFELTKHFAGVSLAIGLVTYLLLLIPILGAVIAPFIGAVGVTLVMHELLPAGKLKLDLEEEEIV
ncbi:MAG: hypothetical protein AAFP19_16390 [Bacteroidota bacterium]